jgi:hypothetical protein
MSQFKINAPGMALIDELCQRITCCKKSFVEKIEKQPPCCWFRVEKSRAATPAKPVALASVDRPSRTVLAANPSRKP